MMLDKSYQIRMADKWEPVLEADGGIKDDEIRLATAVVLENVQREENRRAGILAQESLYGNSPAYPVNGDAQTGTAVDGGFWGNYSGTNAYGVKDARKPSALIPIIRQFFPKLIGHELVGVQAMNSPVSFVYALRAEYNKNRGFAAGQSANAGTLAGYNNLLTDFTGVSGNFVSGGTSAGGVNTGITTNGQQDYWDHFTGQTSTSYGSPGMNSTGQFGGTMRQDGTFNTMDGAEWARLGVNVPSMKFRMTKAVVEAKTRMLGASWPQELQEDMQNMHGLDADFEMLNILSYEIQAEIDRQLVNEMVYAAIKGGTQTCSEWSPVSADGRNQIERIGTLYTHILERSNYISYLTRRGAGNFVLTSPKVTALLQRVAQQVTVSASAGTPSTAATGTSSVEKVGKLGDSHILYRDTFAAADYALIGYKGSMNYDSGVMYCPYIPLQVLRSRGENDFNPRLAVRTRDGILGWDARTDLGEPFGSHLYYQFVKISQLNGVSLENDSGSRVFTYSAAPGAAV